MRRRGSVQSLRSHARQLCPGPVTVCLDAPRSSDVGLVTRRHRHSLFFGTAESEKTRESSKEHPITSGGVRIEGWGSLSRPPQWKPVDASSPPNTGHRNTFATRKCRAKSDFAANIPNVFREQMF